MDNQVNNQEICDLCHKAVLPEYYFCPNCGNKLREELKPISFMTKLGLYALALFLPPLGLWPGAKYMIKKSKEAKKVGAITIVLTILSSILTTWAIFHVFEGYMSQVNTLLNGI